MLLIETSYPIFCYTGSLTPADLSGVVFTCAHFQKIAQISSLCDFHYISEGIPSLMRFWLLMTLSAADLLVLKKTQELSVVSQIDPLISYNI